MNNLKEKKLESSKRNLKKDINLENTSDKIKFLNEIAKILAKVDNTMEHFLQKISDKKKHKKIYCGHYHTDRKIGEDVEMLFASLQEYRKETRLPWDLM